MGVKQPEQTTERTTLVNRIYGRLRAFFFDMCVIFVHIHGGEKRTSGVLIPLRQEMTLPQVGSLYHQVAGV